MNPDPRTANIQRAWIAVLLMGVVMRLFAGLDPFPYWNDDPTLQPAALVGYAPAASLAIDAVMLASSAVVLWSLGAGRTSVLLLLIGAGAGVWHSWTRDGVQIEYATLASGWTAAVTAGVALHAASRSGAHRSWIIAVLAGVVAMLALKGAYQFTIEHPLGVRAFESNKQLILHSRGWVEGSPLALAFERRLRQQEGTGWFALSNVYGSVGAGLFVMLLASLARADRRGLWFRVLGVVLAAAMLYVSQSKGALVAASVGAVLLVLARVAPPVVRGRAGVIGVLVVVAALAMVVVRGILGERLGELSILFRWFYLRGAMDIVRDHPILGVGPAGFQDAFMLRKPPLCPESPASPHSLFIDYACALGTPALAWIALGFGAAAEVSRRLLGRDEGPPRDARESERLGVRQELRLAVLVLTLPMLLGAVMEMEAADLGATLVRFAGLALGGVVAAGVLLWDAAGQRRGSVALAACALALLAHAQIELTPVNLGAASWFMSILGVAAASPGTALARTSRAGSFVAALLAIAAVAAGVRVWTWEARLRDAYEIVTPLHEDQSWLAQARAGGESARDAANTLARSLSGRSGTPVAVTPEAIERAVAAERLARIRQAQDVLASACRAAPSSFLTSRALTSLMLAEFNDSARLGMPSDAIARAEATTAAFVQHRPSPVAWAWLGVIRRNRAEAENNPEHLRASVVAYEHAAALDPRGLDHAVRLAALCRQLGDSTKASAWAARAIRLDDDLRLDPLVRLDASKRRELEGLARGGG